jgi:hypothetical protein
MKKLPNPLMSSVKTPGSLSIKHQSPALVAIFYFFKPDVAHVSRDVDLPKDIDLPEISCIAL